jgi:hypothetical protein
VRPPLSFQRFTLATYHELEPRTAPTVTIFVTGSIEPFRDLGRICPRDRKNQRIGIRMKVLHRNVRIPVHELGRRSEARRLDQLPESANPDPLSLPAASPLWHARARCSGARRGRPQRPSGSGRASKPAPPPLWIGIGRAPTPLADRGPQTLLPRRVRKAVTVPIRIVVEQAFAIAPTSSRPHLWPGGRAKEAPVPTVTGSILRVSIGSPKAGAG